MAVINRIILCVVFIVIAGQTAFAQRKNFIERTLDWGYKIVQGDSAKPYRKYVFAVPIFAYKPETRWLFGVSVAHIFRTRNGDSITRPSLVRLNLSYSQNHQSSVRPYFDIFTNNNIYNFRGLYQYTNFIEYYWGIGATRPNTGKELYSFHLHKFNLKAARLVAPKLYAGIQLNAEKMAGVSAPSGGLLQTEGAYGNTGYSATGFGVTVYYDSRDNVYFPFSGHMIELSNCYYDSWLGSNYRFSNITLDARKYKRLWKENVIAAQVYVNLNTGEVPFRMLATMGSENYMRGYYNGRFRDNNLIACQAELRKTIWGPVAFTAFAGAGSVSHSTSGITDYIKPNFGLGLRMKAIPREHINMRVDMGFMGDGSRAFYITMNEAF